MTIIKLYRGYLTYALRTQMKWPRFWSFWEVVWDYFPSLFGLYYDIFISRRGKVI